MSANQNEEQNNRNSIVRALYYDENIYDSTTYRKRLIKNTKKSLICFIPKIEEIIDDLADEPTTYFDFTKTELDQNDIVYYFHQKYMEKPNVYINMCYTDIQETMIKIFLSVVRTAGQHVHGAENLFYLIPVFSFSQNIVCKAYYINQPQKNESERIFINLNLGSEINPKHIGVYFTNFYNSILKNIRDISTENIYTSIDNCVSDFSNFSNIWRLVEDYTELF